MKTFKAIATIASSLAVASAAQASVLVGYWNFNEFDPTKDTVINADAGSGSVDLTAWGGNLASFAGSTTNTLFDDPAGGSLSLQGGADVDGVFAGNGTYIDVTFSMSGLQDLEISYWTRKTNTGFNANQWSYSINGMDFTNFGDLIDPTSSTSGELIVLSAGAGVNDAAMVTLRYTLDGATSGAGNNRIDNLQLNASVIPAPGAIALLGLAGLVGVSRRRRN